MQLSLSPKAAPCHSLHWPGSPPSSAVNIKSKRQPSIAPGSAYPCPWSSLPRSMNSLRILVCSPRCFAPGGKETLTVTTGDQASFLRALENTSQHSSLYPQSSPTQLHPQMRGKSDWAVDVAISFQKNSPKENPVMWERESFGSTLRSSDTHTRTGSAEGKSPVGARPAEGEALGSLLAASGWMVSDRLPGPGSSATKC